MFFCVRCTYWISLENINDFTTKRSKIQKEFLITFKKFKIEDLYEFLTEKSIFKNISSDI